MIVLLPESFSATRFANDKHARKIVSLILTRQIEQVAKWRSKEHLSGPPRKQEDQLGERARVSRNELARITNSYKKVIGEMADEKILKTYESYSNSQNARFCKAYCLHEKLQKDCLFLSVVRQRKRARLHKDSKGDFTINHRRAADWIDCFDLPEKFVHEYERICAGAEWPDYQRAQVVKLSSQWWWDTVDKFGRYHTPLSNMNKQIRPYLVCNHREFKDSKIVGFDFANFQPALLEHYSPNDLAVQIPEDERGLYSELCRRGKIYQYLADNSFYKTADEAKKALLSMLNQRNERMKATTIWRVFDRLFPNYSQLIESIKQGGEGSHKRMAEFLQTKESQIIFGEVVEKFRQTTGDDVPFFTVHDAVYTVEDAQQNLRLAMERAVQALKISTRVKQETGTIQCSKSQPLYVYTNRGSQENLRLSF